MRIIPASPPAGAPEPAEPAAPGGDGTMTSGSPDHAASSACAVSGTSSNSLPGHRFACAAP